MAHEWLDPKRVADWLSVDEGDDHVAIATAATAAYVERFREDVDFPTRRSHLSSTTSCKRASSWQRCSTSNATHRAGSPATAKSGTVALRPATAAPTSFGFRSSIDGSGFETRGPHEYRAARARRRRRNARRARHHPRPGTPARSIRSPWACSSGCRRSSAAPWARAPTRCRSMSCRGSPWSTPTSSTRSTRWPTSARPRSTSPPTRRSISEARRKR